MTVAETIRRLKSLNLTEIAVSSMKETEKEFIDFNTQKELFVGLDSTGNQIDPLYGSASYAKKKAAINSLPGYGVPDLKLSGDFYKGMHFVSVTADKAIIESSVPYAKYLEKRYGEAIYGLNDKIRPDYIFGPYYSVLKSKVTAVTGFKFS